MTIPQATAARIELGACVAIAATTMYLTDGPIIMPTYFLLFGYALARKHVRAGGGAW